MVEKFEVPPYRAPDPVDEDEDRFDRNNRRREALNMAIRWHEARNASGPDQIIQTAVRFERFLQKGTW